MAILFPVWLKTGEGCSVHSDLVIRLKYDGCVFSSGIAQFQFIKHFVTEIIKAQFK